MAYLVCCIVLFALVGLIDTWRKARYEKIHGMPRNC